MKKITYFLAVSSLLFLAFNTQRDKFSGIVKNEEGEPLNQVHISIVGKEISTTTTVTGKFSISAEIGDELKFQIKNYEKESYRIKDESFVEITLKKIPEVIEVIELEEEVSITEMNIPPPPPSPQAMMVSGAGNLVEQNRHLYASQESYKEIKENIFQRVRTSPLSTFSIDVDRAGYSNIRRMINNGIKIPKDAVKIEEMVNYFNYDYPQPSDEHPFAIHTEIAATPWNQQTKLVKIGLQGKTIPLENIPPSNLVFLIDVSGSMGFPNKLPLLKSAMKLLTDQMRPEDKISIVVYAGAAGLVLSPTGGDKKKRIKEAIDNLAAGGSTAGGAGIKLAYKIAKENFMEGGNNRVILATDGDFNIGPSSDREMQDLIEEERKSGVFLTCLGFGMGNYKDSKLETLADKGNGNHAYIDGMQEAQRVLGTEFGGTLYTIAQDVKIQVEFNPAKVQAYRLLGYENRLLNEEDFKDDEKDAGELGSGHTVTAFYEIIPVGIESEFLKEVDDLKYTSSASKGNKTDLFTVKFRYKCPGETESKLIEKVVKDEDNNFMTASENFKFAAAVALFGMKIRNSEFVKNSDLEQVISLAEAGRGEDINGYRAEFIRLVKVLQ